MWRRVVEASAGQERCCFAGTEGCNAGLLEVRVQVIAPERHRGRMPVSVECADAGECWCNIRVLSLVRDRSFPLASVRLHRHQEVSGAAAVVCVITPSGLPCRGVFDRSRVVEQRRGLLSATEDGVESLVRVGLQVESSLHAPDACRRPGGNAPHVFPATA